jgi:hypothetical protein
MSDEKKDKVPMKNPFEWVFRASVLLLGAAIALNLAVAFIRPILPWIIWSVALASAAWLGVTIWRWRRSRW